MLNKDDKFILMKMEQLEQEKRYELYGEILEEYHQNRAFNAYEDTIKKLFHGGYHLGRTDLKLEKDMQKASHIIDLITLHENENSGGMPEEHEKYLNALVKEFIEGLRVFVKKNEEFMGKERLAPMLQRLRKMVAKGKRNDDAIAVIDNAVEAMEKENQKRLASGQETPALPEPKAKKLEVALSKLGKGVFEEIFKDANSYEEPDFFKIVEHAAARWGYELFKEDEGPGYEGLLKTLMRAPSKKLKGIDFLRAAENYALRQTRKPDSRFAEAADEVRAFLKKLESEGVLGEKDANLAWYLFLSRAKRAEGAKGLREELNLAAKKLFEKELSRLSIQSARTWSEALEIEFAADPHAAYALGLSEAYGNKAVRQKFSIPVSESGAFEKIWSMPQNRIESKWISTPKYEEMGEIKARETLFLGRYLHEHPESPLFPAKEWMRKIRIDKEMDPMQKRKTEYEESRYLVELAGNIVELRLTEKIASEDEFAAILENSDFRQKFYKLNLEEETLSSYVWGAVRSGKIDLSDPKHLGMMFRMPFSNEKKPLFVREILALTAHKETLNEAERMLPEKTDAEKAAFAFDFFRHKLHRDIESMY